MSGTVLMVLIFVLIVSGAFFVIWYNKKYNKKIDVGTVIIVLFISIGVVFYLLIKNMATGEKESIIDNVSLNNTVVEIFTNSHSQYFKDMKLDDGQILPMNEVMNGVLQVGDSIYKTKGEKFYTVVNSKIKSRIKFDVKVHIWESSKPQ